MIAAFIALIKIIFGITAFWAGFKRAAVTLYHYDAPATAQSFAVLICGVLAVMDGYGWLWGVMS